jgi:hypothetical protein
MLNEVVPDDDKAELCKCHKNSNEKNEQCFRFA